MEEKTHAEFQDTDIVHYEHLIQKNLWLVRIRWIYPVFVLIIFLLYQLPAQVTRINLKNFLIVSLLPLLGNVIFLYDIKKKKRLSQLHLNFNKLHLVTSIQMDFDMVVLSLYVFFSGGFESPLILLFIFYTMTATFMIHYQKAFRNTFTAIILVIIITILHNKTLALSQFQVARLLTFAAMLLFTYFVSIYLFRNLRKNEEKMQKLVEKTHELSITDGLTNLYNQSYFFKTLDTETKKSERFNLTYSIIFSDVDNFKNYNDNNGHIRGSEALKQIGSIMKRVFRITDCLAKYGGDEFVIILPQTDKVGAFLAAERFRESVEKEAFTGEEKQPFGGITISLGIANYPEHGSEKGKILDRADRAMYLAKQFGKNQTVIYSEDLEKDEA